MTTKRLRPQCVATTAKGTQCSNRAWPGSDRCGTHDKSLPARAPAPVAVQHDDESFSPEYQELLRLCRREIAHPSPDTTMKQQWARLQLDVVRHALEHQRLREGAGGGFTYTCIMIPPAGPRPVPPSDEPPESESN